MKRLVTLFCIVFVLLQSLYAQNNWTLEKCIQYAIENNISVRQAQLGTKISEENLSRSQFSRLPAVNGFASNIWNFGQTIDPFTNEFAQERVRSNQLGVQANMTIFNGMQQHNNVERNKIELQANLYDLEAAKNDISLAVANAYLEVLSSHELLSVAEQQTFLTQKQLDQTKKLLDAGVVPMGNYFEIEAQLANEELNKVNAQNNLTLGLLRLQQLLQLEYSEDFDIARPQITVPLEENKLRAINIYNRSLDFLPQLKSAQLRLMASETDIALAKGGLSPRLNFNASLGSGYSGRNFEPGAFITETVPIGFTQSGEMVTRDITQGTDFTAKPFNKQLNENFNQSVGFNLTVPIFNGLTNRTNINQAKINQEIQSLNLENTKNQIRQDIETAFANAQAAKNNYLALQKSVASLTEAFKYAQKNYDVGAINALEYNNSKTLLTIAEANQIRAKYNYIFSLKILDFYQGVPITLAQ